LTWARRGVQTTFVRIKYLIGEKEQKANREDCFFHKGKEKTSGSIRNSGASTSGKSAESTGQSVPFRWNTTLPRPPYGKGVIWTIGKPGGGVRELG